MIPTAVRQALAAGIRKIAETEAKASAVALALETIDNAVQQGFSTSSSKGEALKKTEKLLAALKYGKSAKEQAICDTLWKIFKSKLEKFPLSRATDFRTKMMAEYGKLRKKLSSKPFEEVIQQLPKRLWQLDKSRLQSVYKKVKDVNEPLPRSAIFTGSKVSDRAVRPIEHLLKNYGADVRRVYMDAMVDLGVPYGALYTIKRDILLHPEQPPEQVLPAVYHELAHALNGKQWFQAASHPEMDSKKLEQYVVLPEAAASLATLGYIKWLKREYDHPVVLKSIQAGLLPTPDDDPIWQRLVGEGKVFVQQPAAKLTPMDLLASKDPWIPELKQPGFIGRVFGKIKSLAGA